MKGDENRPSSTFTRTAPQAREARRSTLAPEIGVSSQIDEEQNAVPSTNENNSIVKDGSREDSSLAEPVDSFKINVNEAGEEIPFAEEYAATELEGRENGDMAVDETLGQSQEDENYHSPNGPAKIIL